ncbi:MAG: glycosyltransferase family 4 protein [Lachnospiraceae bacterium]|nr:glycosyltransferase family 4 protein [Lachnospiraceae bacterium]
MKKVLIIHHSGVLGGAGTSLMHVIESLQDKYDVTLYISAAPRDMVEKIYSKNLKVTVKEYTERIGALTYYEGGDNAVSPRFMYRTLLIAKQRKYWQGVIDSEKPDIFIVNSKILSWFGSLDFPENCKTVCFVRESLKGNKDSWLNKRIRRYLDMFTQVFFLSEYDTQQIKLEKAETVVVPNFISPENYNLDITKEEAYDKLNIPSEDKEFNVLYAGGVNHLKGFDVAVKAASLLKNDNIKFTVAGNGFGELSNPKNFKEKISRRGQVKFEQDMKEIISQQGLESKFNFIGRQSNMSYAYTACDALIFPMTKPHQARPVFEAGYYHKPAIISDFPNIKEYVHDDINGKTFDVNDVEELVKVLKEMADNKEKTDAMGEANYEQTMRLHYKDNNMAYIIKKLEE